MAKRGRPTKTDSILRSIKDNVEIKTPVATEMFLPNHSGIASHPEATSNFSNITHTHTESDITDLQSYLLNVVEDTTPQLGGELDCNASDILLRDASTSLKSGDYELQFQSAKLEGVGAVPSGVDGNKGAQWNMDDGSGTNVEDSDSTHDGTLQGNTAWVGSGFFGYAGDDSLTFDGTEDYVTVPNDVSVFDFDSAFSWYAWVKFDVNNTNQAIVTKMDSASSFRGFTFYKNINNDLTCQLIRTSGSIALETNGDAGTTLTDGEYHMVAMTYDGSTNASGVKFYIDGVLLSNSVNEDNLTGSVEKDVNIEFGRRGDTALDLQGDMDCVVFYIDVRTGAEVLSDWNNSNVSGVADAIIIGNSTTYANSGSNLVTFKNNTTEILNIDKDGGLVFPTTDSGLAFGEISVEGNSTSDTIATNTWHQVTRFDTASVSSRTTPDATENHITIDEAGMYLVTISVAFSGDNSVDWEASLFKNNGSTEITNVHMNRKLGSGGDIGSASMSGICDCASTDTMELWFRHQAGVNKSITFQDVTMSVVKIGGT